jgi:chromosome segregation ATPase
MNVVETSQTMKGVKSLQNEINAWEGRLLSVKNEVASLTKQREGLKTEVEQIQERCNREVEKKLMEARKTAAKVEEDQKKLESDKEEFQKILLAHRQEKNVFEREKQAVTDMKNDAQKTLDNVGVFIRMVRDGAAKL